MVATVFSASNYCGYSNNSCGVLIIGDNGNVSKRTFPAFEYLRRERVHFNDSVLPNHLMPAIFPPCHGNPHETIISSTRKLISSFKQIKQPLRKNVATNLDSIKLFYSLRNISDNV
jgi:hypothetical protein